MKIKIEEIEKYIIGKKIKDIPIEEIKKIIEVQGQTIIMLQNIIEEKNKKINKVAGNIGHELYGHILQNDEETWNKEFYTDGKLDYRKLLIHLLEETFEILEVDGSKWYEYED